MIAARCLAMSRYLVIALLIGCTEPEPAAIALWEPVDESFAGCHGACGAHEPGPHESAIVQPDATVGSDTYCPVSGAFFRIEDRHPHRDVDGERFYFCCDGCADYFAAHTDEVLAARGIN